MLINIKGNIKSLNNHERGIMRYHHKLQLNLSTALLLATAPTALHAQAASGGENAAARPADAGGVVMDEIIVTAQKRSERLIDVPMSITAASGEQLAKQGIKSEEHTSELQSLMRISYAVFCLKKTKKRKQQQKKMRRPGTVNTSHKR